MIKKYHIKVQRKMKTKNKRNYLKERGITLIALVVTIVVLLILSGVTISEIFSDEGLWDKSNEFSERVNSTIEKKLVEINSMINELNEIMNSKEQNKEEGEEIETGDTSKELIINKSNLMLELQEEVTLTASLSNITGEITWNISDNTKATIKSTTEESIIIVTAVAVGETTITATCGNYTATCKVTVKEPIAIGSYVEYDVPYIDMYSNIEYTKTTGWRYLGKDDAGNQLIVSTGIPALLLFDYNTNMGNIEDGGANSWWATKAEISATTDTLYQTTKGYDYDTDSGEPNKYAAYGLRYKFDKIPFTYQASETSISTANTGIFRKVGNITSGENISLNFKADGVNVVDVHNLTLAELNRATNKASGTTRTDTETSEGFKNLRGTALGLFNMKNLTNYTQNYEYWLATPNTGIGGGLYYVDYLFTTVSSGSSPNWGVRPVITLPSDVNLTVVE